MKKAPKKYARVQKRAKKGLIAKKVREDSKRSKKEFKRCQTVLKRDQRSSQEKVMHKNELGH